MISPLTNGPYGTVHPKPSIQQVEKVGPRREEMVRSVFEPPTLIEQFLYAPLKTLVRIIYGVILILRGPAYGAPLPRQKIRVVCISDTHTKQAVVPDGDVLIHAGDLGEAGTAAELQAQIDWLRTLPHREKVVIAGNHDGFLDRASRRAADDGKSLDWGRIRYLERESVTLTFPDRGNRELHVYGAPEIPRCGGDDFAFQHAREQDVWTDTIPPETDILVTHAPPKYHLDLPAALGDRFLLRQLWRVRPRLHVFGHVHAGYGRETAHWDDTQEAYERIMSRKTYGPLSDVCSIPAWWDALTLLMTGLQGILWSRVWGGTNRGSVLVNASLSYRSTGRLGNPAQTVDI